MGEGFTVLDFEIIGEIVESKPIAIRHSIREVARLRKQYGEGRWRKLKGRATVRLKDGSIRKAEIHWYEAHGIGKEDRLWIKRTL